jgi:hypothetical protein
MSKASETLSTSSAGGVSTGGLLGLIFVTLKLCGVIDWSWWWVTLPFWLVPAVLLAFAAAVFLVSMLFSRS